MNLSKISRQRVKTRVNKRRLKPNVVKIKNDIVCRYSRPFYRDPFTVKRAQ